jgi:hypothetical protein
MTLNQVVKVVDSFFLSSLKLVSPLEIYVIHREALQSPTAKISPQGLIKLSYQAWHIPFLPRHARL